MELFIELARFVKPIKEISSEEEIAESGEDVLTKRKMTTQEENMIKGAIVNVVPDKMSDWMIYRVHNIPGYSRVKLIKDAVQGHGVLGKLFKKEKNEEHKEEKD